ncbi:uncharacterized protein LOC132054692 [Lycium ferocissimum]|uniref:uncharacterized protein LOC132054692 n=1 Tax=Lycium ferocissimum TaxID=112874 RepID=UPI002815A98E|nr:uncharacterized protein LOC132054692 [Lycium ferocissimum]
MDNFDIFYELEPLFDGDEWDHRKISPNQIHKEDQILINKEQKKEPTGDDQKIVMQENGQEQKSNTEIKDLKADDDVKGKKEDQNIPTDLTLLNEDQQNEASDDAEKMAMQENGQEQKGEIEMQDLKDDYEVKGKKEAQKISTDQILLNEKQKNEARDYVRKMAMQENEQEQKSDIEMPDLKAADEIKGKKEAPESTCHEPLVERRTNPLRVSRRATPVEVRPKRKRINAADSTLPDDWDIEVRVRKNGSTSGHKDTYYIEKSTGKVCRSRMDVLRYQQSKQAE